MQHEEFVETAVARRGALPLDVAIAHVDLGGCEKPRRAVLWVDWVAMKCGLFRAEVVEPHGEAAGDSG